MTNLLPIALNISGWSCLVIGGGPVAARRTKTLLESGANVTVIAPKLVGELETMAAAGAITHIASTYESTQLENVRLCVIATDNPDVNLRAARDASERGILVNNAETPSRGDFVIPSVVRRGDLVLAVTTGGASPSLTRRLAERLAGDFGPEWETFVSILAEARTVAAASIENAARRRELLNRLADDEELLILVREGRGDEARARALLCISS